MASQLQIARRVDQFPVLGEGRKMLSISVIVLDTTRHDFHSTGGWLLLLMIRQQTLGITLSSC